MGIDADVTEMLDDALSESGVECLYIRGTATAAITQALVRSQGPQLVELGTGAVMEVVRHDVIMRTNALPFQEPEADDLIKVGGSQYLVKQYGSEKVYRKLSPQLLRIHTVQVK